MRLLYDFRCKYCGQVEEKLVDMEVREVECPKCQGVMKRLISPVRSALEGHTGHFPDAADKWAKMHEKEGRKPPPQ